MGSLEYSEYISTPIYDDDGTELWYCSFHDTFEPREAFYANKHTRRGFQTYCKVGQRIYNEQSMSSDVDKNRAYELLSLLGYDIHSGIPIHLQFDERHKKNI